MQALITLLLCAALLSKGARTAPDASNALARMAQSDPIHLWQTSAVNSATEAVSLALKPERVAVRDADQRSLRVWHGSVLELALEVGDKVYQFQSGGLPESEGEWSALLDTLPAAQGGIVPQGDWDALERNWVRPVRAGPSLPDFTLAGPLDLVLTPPAQPQLWLPHPVETGPLRRVLLRDGAAVTVRGAARAALRRAVDLPAVSLSDFASFAAEDGAKGSAAGLMHLAAGLRERAAARWAGAGGNGTTPALVAVDLELAEGAGALLAAPADGGGLQRLRVRRLGEGVVELEYLGLERAADARVLALTPASPFAWPLRDAEPQTLLSYEHLLREVLASEIFGSDRQVGGGGPRPAPDVPLRLRRSAARAMMLMRMELELERPQRLAAGGAEGEAAAAVPLSVQQLIQRAATGAGTSVGSGETWSAVLRVEGNAAEGLRFTLLRMSPVRVEHETTTFAPDALQGLVAGNYSRRGGWLSVAE